MLKISFANGKVTIKTVAEKSISLFCLKEKKNLLMALHRYKIILNKGTDRWCRHQMAHSLNTDQSEYLKWYISVLIKMYLWNNYLIFQKAGSSKKGAARQKETAVNQNMIKKRNKSTMKLNYRDLYPPLFFFFPIFILVGKQKFCNIPDSMLSSYTISVKLVINFKLWFLRIKYKHRIWDWLIYLFIWRTEPVGRGQKSLKKRCKFADVAKISYALLEKWT